MEERSHIAEAWFFTSELEGERAGRFRQERWCRIFLEQGIPVRIFNVRGGFGLTCARVDSEAALADFHRATGHRSGARASVREGLAARTLRRLKHALLVDLYYPNIFLMVLRALSEIRRVKGRVLLMGSSPPFSMAVAAAVVRALCPRGVDLAVDMRDAWAMHLSLGGSRRLKLAIERAVFRRAAGLSTVSFGLSDEFGENHGVKVDVLYNVASHYFDVPARREVDWTALCPTIGRDRIKLVYTGSVPEGFYDLPAMVNALKEFRATSPALAERLQLVFVGACEEVRRELKRQQVQGDDVVFISHVPHDVAKAIQQNADALLYLTYRGKGAVSTKIFEYFALGKPILPLFVPQGSDVDRLLETYCGMRCNLHTPNEITEAFTQTAGPAGLSKLPCLRDPFVVRRLLDDYRLYARRLLAVSP